ncbi:arginine N-succinyltransferase [Thermodesulfobacteriota bacterium]
MMENNHESVPKTEQKRWGCLQVIGLLVVAVIITAGITTLVLKTYFFPTAFKPVVLSGHEEQILTAKIENIDSMVTGVKLKEDPGPETPSKSDRHDPKSPLKPEPYNEKGMKREIAFTERELNALIAKNTDLATKLAIDLSDDLISAKLLLPVDEDFPIFGGKILRVRGGLVLKYDTGKPVVMLKGIAIMGVPIPNAWLGGIKNIDMVKEFGADTGFWKAFSDGVEGLTVMEGRFVINLRE